MSTGKMDRGDKVALAAGLVLAGMVGVFVVCYVSLILLVYTEGRPLRKLVRAFRSAAAARMEAEVQSVYETEYEDYDPEAMVELYRKQADSCLAQGDTVTAASYLDMMGYTFTGLEDMDSALACHRRAVDLRAMADIDPLLEAGGRVAVAGTFASFGMQDSALVEYLAVHDVYVGSGDEYLSCWGPWWLRNCLEELGEERFLEVCRGTGRDAEKAAGLLKLARDAETPSTGG